MPADADSSWSPSVDDPSTKRPQLWAALPAPVMAALRESVAEGSPVPAYHRLELALRGLLGSGALVTPTRLPPEDQFAALLHIDRGTLRRALRRLERDGMIERSPGRGTTITRAAADP